jgi:hypothetical protein
MEKNSTTDDMKTLVVCVNKAVVDGYIEDFKINGNKLLAMKEDKEYSPEHVHIKDFFRFEGASDPSDNSILYLIETDDGIKGTLIDAYGSYADQSVSKFIQAVEDINKKAAIHP